MTFWFLAMRTEEHDFFLVVCKSRDKRIINTNYIRKKAGGYGTVVSCGYGTGVSYKNGTVVSYRNGTVDPVPGRVSQYNSIILVSGVVRWISQRFFALLDGSGII